MSGEARAFPIMGSKVITSVPWAIVEPARAQLYRNHSQTVERLASRGGLDPVELMGALRGLAWGNLGRLSLPKCEVALARIVERHAAQTAPTQEPTP